MVALQILVLSVQVRILVSQHETANPLIFSGFCVKNLEAGTQTGQINSNDFSLHDVVMELCKEKKMHFFKPTAYVHYVPAKLHDRGTVWYISFYVTDPSTQKLKRQRIKLNHITPVRERRKASRQIIAHINEKLSLGWNPLVERTSVQSVKFFDAMDLFLKSKSKESEDNTMRAYRSHVKIMKDWLLGKGFDADSYACSFTHEVAVLYMNDVDSDDGLCAQTYNNKLRFYMILCNWMVEKGFISSNPFEGIKRKPKKLTKKTRRTLTQEELERLWSFLERENQGFHLICLFCYCCFLRPKEIVLLKCGDIDLKNQIVNVRSEIAKNDNDSQRTIPDAMVPYLRRLDMSNRDWYIFSGSKFEFLPGSEKIWSQRISDYWANVVRPACDFDSAVQFYSLKDTGITNMLGQGVPASFVKQQADHSSLSMTSVYLGKSSRAAEEIKRVGIL